MVKVLTKNPAFVFTFYPCILFLEVFEADAILHPVSPVTLAYVSSWYFKKGWPINFALHKVSMQQAAVWVKEEALAFDLVIGPFTEVHDAVVPNVDAQPISYIVV